MCRFCEQNCDRSGGERPCELSDAEFDEAMNGPEYVSDEIEDFEEALNADAEKLLGLGADPGRKPTDYVCLAISPDRFICNKEPGHTDDHVAYAGTERVEVDRWENKSTLSAGRDSNG